MAAAKRGFAVGAHRRWFRVAFATLAVLPLLGGVAHAATITVTTNGDDLTPNDGSVSLREAIQAIDAGSNQGDPDIINQNPGTFGVNDTINFNISGAAQRQTITVGSTGNRALPALTKPVAINGYSEPHASVNTLVNADNAVVLVALDGASAGPADGLLVGGGAASSTIQGLDIFDFSLNQIELQGGSDAVIGDDLGYDTTGTPTRSAVGGRVGNSGGSVIGGATPATRNLISGNVGSGVEIVGSTGSPATGNVVEGNFIGTGPTGTVADGNASFAPYAGVVGAVQISGGNGNVIGGASAGARNVISGNGGGVDIRNGGENNIVQGNFIGVGADGVTAVPNAGFGVHIGSDDNLPPPGGPGQANEPAAFGNVIGLNPNTSFGGLGNLIADNGGDGVQIDGSVSQNNGTQAQNSGNSVSGNAIFANSGLGIDLKTGSGIPKPNNSLKAPVISSITPAASSSAVKGTLSLGASTNMTVRVELFSSSKCDSGGAGEGEELLGSASTTTDGSGNASFTANVSPTLTPGQIITATTTNTTADPSTPAGSVNLYNTSQFSTCFTVPLRSSAVVVSCSPGSVAVAAPAPCTATVSDTAAGTASTPAGTVTFATTGSGSFSGSGSCTLSAGSCQLSYTPAAAGSGTHTVTASYGGDATHAVSSASTGESVVARSTVTTVSCSPVSVFVEVQTICIATVADTSAGTASTPAGTVTFATSGAGSFPGSGSCTLSAGSCHLGYTPTTAGSGIHTITASYGGDTAHASSVGKESVRALPAPSNHFTVTHAHVQANGMVGLDVTVPGAGVIEVLVTAPTGNLSAHSAALKPGKGQFAFATARVRVKHAGRFQLAVQPAGRGRTLLAHHRHRVTLTLSIVFTPTGGQPRRLDLRGLHPVRQLLSR